MASYLRWIILLKFLLLNGARYSAAAQEPDETETCKLKVISQEYNSSSL